LRKKAFHFLSQCRDTASYNVAEIPFVVEDIGRFITERLKKVVASVDEQSLRRIALQASGEYLMNHLDGVVEMVQDTRAMRHEGELTDVSLDPIEEQIKVIAEDLIRQSRA
jgi:hypothetical protein